jgi:hypothetical protein
MGIFQQAVSDRLKGERPSAVRAFSAAAIAGVVVAGVVYKALRA